MAITISGENNNDRILAQDGVIDQLSGFNVVGVITATSFTGDLTGNVTGNVTGNLTGNVNSTSNLLLQIGGSEKIRVGGSGQLGIGGANYGTSGQVLTSGGSGSAVSWSTISTDLINDSSPQLGGTLDTNQNNIHFNDNVSVRFGSSQDFDIYHTGTRGIIKNNTGELDLFGNDIRFFSGDGGETLAKFIDDGAVELYHNNEAKILTQSNGATVQDLTATGAYLSITSSSGNNGKVYGVNGTTLGFLDSQNHWLVKGIKDGGVELYYNNAKTLQTTVNALHLFGNAYECNIDLKLDNGNRVGFLGFTNSGRVQINGAAGGNAYETYLEGNLNGSTKLFYDHTPKIETTTRGIRLQSGLTSGNGISNMLQLDNDGNSNGDGSYITFSRAGYLRSKIGAIKNETSNNETDIVFETTLAGSIAEKVRIPSTGGIELKTDGRGIKFPDTQTPTNDDNNRVGISSEMRYYETGTFTPGLSSTVLNSLQNQAFTDNSYARRVGRYVRIGHLVHVTVEILMAGTVTYTAGVSDSTTPPCITGVTPFFYSYNNRYAVSGQPDYYPCAISYSSTGLTNDTLYAVYRRDFPAQSRIEITKPGTGGSRQYNSTNFGEVFPANAHINVSFTYCIDTNNADY